MNMILKSYVVKLNIGVNSSFFLVMNVVFSGVVFSKINIFNEF